MGRTSQNAGEQEITSTRSQLVRLNRIVKETYRVVAVGIALFLVFSIVNIVLQTVSEERLESTMFLNQYRMGSKALTSEVQSFAVTGDAEYYEAYMKELNNELWKLGIVS